MASILEFIPPAVQGPLSAVTEFVNNHLVLSIVVGSFTLFRLSIIIYNLYFHPLARFPGPRAHAISNFPWYWYYTIQGTAYHRLVDWHRQYGDIVRIRPNELSFTNPDAWHEVMGHRARGPENGKDPQFFNAITVGPPNLATAPRELHSVTRRLLSHGFSEASMRAQEPLIRGYVDLLIQRLSEHSEGGKKALNMSAWYMYTTFDVIGDLAFGEPFDCLQNSEMHPWIQLVISMGRFVTILQFLSLYPWFKAIFLMLLPSTVTDAGVRHNQLAKEKLARRMEKEERPDLINNMIHKHEQFNLSLAHVQTNAEMLITAGSETTSTMLAGTTFYLATHPEHLKKVVQEVRSTFKSPEEITLLSVSNLPYMLACLNEGLRLYHPVAAGLPRVTNSGGSTICGEFIPPNVTVSIPHYATYRMERNFTDANSFHPERFLGDEKYANDKWKAFQPFHVGPRDCVGRNLAFAEMRLILSRILYHFDLQISEDSTNWVNQNNFVFWNKPELNVFLTRVQ
ncbi:cytochrome P450 [Aspergillus crustosus]